MKIIIYGAGFIGTHLEKNLAADHEVVLLKTNITSKEDIERDVENFGAQVIVNCAGKTGKPNIDWCEDHKKETLDSNVLGPIVLSDISQAKGIRLIHVSSGCIYQGDNGGKGFSELDAPNFCGSFYSRTKIWAEEYLVSNPHSCILRLRMPITAYPNPKNFITKIVGYEKVISVENSVTIIEDLFRVIRVAIEKNLSGVYNVTNPYPITHKEILDMYKEIVDPSFTYNIMSLEELKKYAKAPRSNCVLNTDKLSQVIQLDDSRVALRKVLEEYKLHFKEMQGKKEGINDSCFCG